jgi:metal-sulfur cluster biosynthetic enzyme
MTAVKIEQSDKNEHVRRYHVKMALTEAICESTDGDSLGAVGQAVQRMPGVERVFVCRYTLQVSKGEARTWEEVEAALLPFLEAMK